MKVDVAIIRYGDPIRELDNITLKFDSIYSYSRQYDLAISERSGLIIGKRDRRAKKIVPKRIYYTLPVLGFNGTFFRWIKKGFYELFSFYILTRYRPKIAAVVGGSLDLIAPYFYSKIFGAKLSMVFHQDIKSYNSFLEPLVRFSLRIAKNTKINLLTNGLHLKNQLETIGIPKSRIDVHSLYYPSEYFIDHKVEKIFNRGKFIVTFVGRFDYSKGIIDVIEIAEIVLEKIGKDAVFVLIGDGYMKDKAIGLRNRLKCSENVVFLGMRPNNMVNSYMNKSHVILVPSYKECFGKVLAEALMAGTAAIAYDTGGLSCQIEDGVNGFLVPVGDYKAMAERVIRLYNNPGLRKAISEEAIKARNLYDDPENTLGAKLKRIFDNYFEKKS
jgi:glycosyltransferase involved in cell wall biosynthesis